ncbi:serine/threonine protein kinase [Brevibacterium casei]|uniref:serine/threonine protein kinase n=1 Tax=Brevibacterium casei TaxID=33889 RepID=UPI0009D97F5C
MLDILRHACIYLQVEPQRPLYQGGQKQVHVVKRSDGTEVVLKLIDLGQATDPAALERAQREVDLLQKIDHPNVVSVVSELELIDHPQPAAIWLEELLDGNDLRHSSYNWSYEDLKLLGSDIASGLGALHDLKVIHRDLSPGNIQCLTSRRYVVMDPGFARHTLRSGLTIGGQPGTPGFMTPEHIQQYSGAPTAASDVFGCCSLVYFAACGNPPVPFKGDESEYLSRLRTAEHRPLQTSRPDLPETFCQVIERGLHPQPARRYRNGKALKSAFEEA